MGVFPLFDHYYDPQFDHRKPTKPFSQDRFLPGIDWNTNGQLKVLESFAFTHRLEALPLEKTQDLEFYVHNETFGSGERSFGTSSFVRLNPGEYLR